ncbi:MAG: cysteine--tRNA ligase [archaeon]
MKVKLYNTLTRKKEEFKPIRKNEVGFYSCGLTVYGYGHIGNYRAFVSADILRRVLEYNGYKVKQITNITDVDDKTIKGSQKEGKSLKEHTKPFEEAYFEDSKSLNIEDSFKYPKATEHIKEMVDIIKKLLKKGLAYKAEDGIYFNIKKFKNYGKLARLKLVELKEGGSKRIKKDEYDKENAQDFVLWKFYDKEDGEVCWDTEIGKGRPGWHIECSAMSMKYLGENFDIHSGGIDLVFPHHENEIAQSEGATGKQFVKYWVHNEWILVDGKKMSKSLGNFYTLKDIKEKDYSPLDMRYFYLTGHYKTQLNFTWKNLESSKNALQRARNILSEIKDDGKENKKYLEEFEKAMNNDLDMPKALQVLWKLLRDKKAEGKIKTIKKMDEVFGLDLLKEDKFDIPEKVEKLAEEREKARKAKDWEKADDLRGKISKLGYQIDDTEQGTRIKKI